MALPFATLNFGPPSAVCGREKVTLMVTPFWVVKVPYPSCL